jgi:hypothetical protein
MMPMAKKLPQTKGLNILFLNDLKFMVIKRLSKLLGDVLLAFLNDLAWQSMRHLLLYPSPG